MFIVIFALSVISMCYSSVRFMQQQRKLMIIKKIMPKNYQFAWFNGEYLFWNFDFC